MTSPEPLPPRPAASLLALRPLPIEVFDPRVDAQRHAGRSAVRETVLAMLPMSGAEPLLPGPTGRGGATGVFWGLRSRNDLTVALRAASFESASAARADAVEVLSRAAELEILPVCGRGNVASFWALLDGRLVLVGGQALSRSAAAVAQPLRDALSFLPRDID